jgi:hypothetical protein
MMLKKDALLQDNFQQKMQNQMNNGDFAILISYQCNRSMEDALRKQIPSIWWFVFTSGKK